jgi:hypothetical protein
MAVSTVSIANRALQRIGAKSIESLTQDSPNARSISKAYEHVRRALIRRYRWSFAIKRASVAADVDGTAWGGLNRFSLKNDHLRLIRDKDHPDLRKDWKIEGTSIVTADASPLQYRYIADITDPSLMDASFVEAFALALAAAICKEVTGSEAEVRSVREELREAVNMAKNDNAIEEDPQVSVQDDWLDAMISGN